MGPVPRSWIGGALLEILSNEWTFRLFYFLRRLNLI